MCFVNGLKTVFVFLCKIQYISAGYPFVHHFFRSSAFEVPFIIDLSRFCLTAAQVDAIVHAMFCNIVFARHPLQCLQ